MVARLDRDELRLLIREALREALGHESPPALRQRDREGGKAQDAKLPSPTPNPSPQGGGESLTTACRFSSGVLTEAKVAALGKTHTKIIISAEVAVTPLAREKGREMKVEIVRETP
jgi:hypothetical protein